MDITTFSELFQYVEETFGGEAINPGRNKQITLSIPVEEFDEDTIYEFLPEWSGKYTNDENVISYEGEIIVYTGLIVDTSDGDALLPFEDLDLDDEDEEDEEDWEDDNISSWPSDDDI